MTLVGSFCSNADAAFTIGQLSSFSNDPMWITVFDDTNLDYSAQPSADIVGATGAPAFLRAYQDNGSASNTDGDLAFRVRMNSQNGNKTYFGGSLWIGVEANGDGAIDAYLSYSDNAQGLTVSIYSAGANTNVSPSTTSVTAPTNTNATYQWTDPSYANYRAVTTSDSGVTNAGIPGNTAIDWYVTFQVPFASLVGFLADSAEMGVGNTFSITDQTPLRFVVFTSTQSNSINQDIGGVDQSATGYNANARWDSYGTGGPMSPATIPEPTSCVLGLMGALAILLRRRRQV